jgi:hypothetical protein
MSIIVISFRRGHLARSGVGIGIREGARIAQRTGVHPPRESFPASMVRLTGSENASHRRLVQPPRNGS